MDIVDILPEYLDVGLEEGELEEIAVLVLTKQVKALKEAIGVMVVNARSATMMDDMEGSSKALGQARKMKKQYHHFVGELNRLTKGDEAKPASDELEE